MPKLDKTGPEGKGSGTGRNLGKCINKKNENSEGFSFEKGLGLRKNVGGGKGLGKRLRSFFRCP
ncbi:MAG TPA: DUF5320 domain-containing protein [Bacteroidales bacterium]|nr:DUF5320 domain-containing protein [Bacteroidales bacterium]HPS17774.1 DUF5320 domain-containing protein [Bacteroidales bacterium]